MVHTKVARILSPQQLVLAAGTNDGVKEGMEFVIFDQGDEIFDPETGQSLGRLEIVKGKVAVSHVQDMISIATTSRRVVKRVENPLESYLARMNPMLPKEVSEVVYDQLRVEGVNAAKSDLIVRVGDLARSLVSRIA